MDICPYAMVRKFMGKATQDSLKLIKVIFSNENRVVLYIYLFYFVYIYIYMFSDQI